VADGFGRVIGAAGNHPGSTGGYRLINTNYDLMGRSVKVSNPTEVNSSWVPSGDDAAGIYYTQQTYDWKDRPLVTTNPDLTTRTASYSGCGCAGGEVVTLTDEGTIDAGVAKRRQQKIYSDVFGRTVKTEILNWQGGSVYSSTVNTYNVRDQVTQVRQYAGADGSGTYQDTTTTYDGYGRLKTKHVPEQTAGLFTTYNYNPDDSLLSVVDARGASATFGYNGRRLLNAITYNAPAGSGITIPGAVTYSYDAVGNRTAMSDGVGSTSYSYDQVSKITSETRHFTGLSVNYTTAYQYNLAGQLKSVTDPRNVTVNYTRNAIGDLTAVTGSNPAGTATYATNIQHRAWRGLKHQQYGNGYTLDAIYNNRLQAANFQISFGSGSVISKTYTYHDDSTLKFSSDSVDHRFDRSYSWDHANRIKEAYSGAEARGEAPTHDRPYRQNYSYDAFNHLTDRTFVRWEIPQSTSDSYVNNRHVPVGTDWSYDYEGNVLSPPGIGYNYDAAGRIAAMQLWPTDSTLSWDGDGRQVKAVEVTYDPETNTNTTTTTYHVFSSVLGEEITEIKDSVFRTFVYAEGTMLAWHEPDGSQLYNTWYEFRDPGNATLRTTSTFNPVGLAQEFDPTGTDAGTSNGIVESTPDEGSLAAYPATNNPSHPNMTYSVDGIRVPLDHFVMLVEMAFHGNMGLMDAMGRATSTVVGTRTTGVSWGRRFTQDTDVNGRTTNVSWGSYSQDLTHVSYSQTTNIYAEASLGLLGGLFDPQNAGGRLLTTDETNALLSDVQKMISNPDCAKFVESLLSQLAIDTGRQQHGTTDILKLFEAVRAGRGFDWNPNLSAQATGGGGPGNASISIKPVLSFANLTNSSSGARVYRGRTIIHELFHVAGYGHDAMAMAAYRIGERFDSGWHAWKGDFPNPQDAFFQTNDPKEGTARLDDAYSGFFGNVLNQHCK
jgi:hypothetical protein